MLVYLVEDDNNIRKLVTYALSNSGYEAKGFALPDKFHKAMDNELPDLIMLDIMLPQQNGLDILKQLKNSNIAKNIPVIMLTAKTSEYDKVIGLDLGADDYISKPFGMMELISRVKAVLRRTNSNQAEEYEYKGLYVCPSKHIVRVNEKEVTLALKEFELLCMLFKNQGTVLTRDTLLNKIWGYSFDGETRTVDVHIRKLRLKLGENNNFIETVKGIGYKIGGK